MSVRDEIERSAARFLETVAPLFISSPLDGNWERLEGTEVGRWLDVDHGCDWLLRRSGGRATLVSTRTQLEGSHQNWTIRYRSEFEKLISTDASISSGWTVQSHAWSDGEVIRAAAIRTGDLARMLRRGQYHPEGGLAVAGGQRMVWVDWRWARSDGYEVVEREGPGAARLGLRGWRREQEKLF